MDITLPFYHFIDYMSSTQLSDPWMDTGQNTDAYTSMIQIFMVEFLLLIRHTSYFSSIHSMSMF